MISDEELLQLSRAGDKLRLPFTGERVVPGAVEAQLWKEHISRYRFACLFAGGKRVVDVGCGTGYGTELLGRTAEVAIGFDYSPDAICYSSASFPNARYLCGSATNFPLRCEFFHLVTAFEVIEHLADWNALIEESARVLTPDGALLVSTPNKEYYAETRGNSGPNLFHVHEFEIPEFEAALGRVFPFVQILAQNQQECITFTGEVPAQHATASIPPTDNLANAHFFLAACSFQPLIVPSFADISSTHNLLREREKHIRGLQGELADAQGKHSGLVAERQRLSEELEIARQQSQSSLRRVEDTLAAAQRQLEDLQLEQKQARSSGWVRLGHKLGVGPWSNRGKGSGSRS